MTELCTVYLVHDLHAGASANIGVDRCVYKAKDDKAALGAVGEEFLAAGT